MNLISSFEQITTGWLENILKLKQDSISTFEVFPGPETPVSQVAIVKIIYLQRSNNNPSSVFLKITKSNLQKDLIGLGKKEVKFYNEVAIELDKKNIPYCYFADYDDQSNIFNIVLENLSETHISLWDYPLPPSLKYCKMAVKCLAKIHAYWWDHERLQSITGKFETKEHLTGVAEWFHKTSSEFLTYFNDRISPERKSIISNISANYEKLFERYLQYKNLTFVHRDAHIWNFMLPKNENDPIKFFDWENFMNGVGADDIAYMIALSWFPEQRKIYEKELINTYYNTLLENGVRNYDFEDLMLDYKHAVIRQIFVPIWQWENKFWSVIWFGNFERCLSAYEDLNCAELLE